MFVVHFMFMWRSEIFHKLLRFGILRLKTEMICAMSGYLPTERASRCYFDRINMIPLHFSAVIHNARIVNIYLISFNLASKT